MRLFLLGMSLSLAAVISSCRRPPAMMAGVAVYGHEARTIRLCGEERYFWLHTGPQQHQRLTDEFQRLTDQPYQELYLELSGRLESSAPGELAREYAGTIRVETIKLVARVIPPGCETGRGDE